MKLLLFFLLAILLTSCGWHYADGTSVWSAGLWLAPVLPAIGAIIFFIIAYRSSKSGSIVNPNLTGGKKVEGGNVPLTQIGWFWFSVICAVATIGILIWIKSDI